MLVYSDKAPAPFDASGVDLRVRWNIVQKEKIEPSGEITTYWEYEEALCSVFDTRDQIIQKIIASTYVITEELAAINNGGDSYAAYQSFRALSKTLADTWLGDIKPQYLQLQ